MFFKTTRLKDREFLDQVKMLPCVSCNKFPPSDPAHIKSVGAGGGDSWDNVIPLCRACHRLQHDKGWFHISSLSPRLQHELRARGREDLIKSLSLI